MGAIIIAESGTQCPAPPPGVGFTVLRAPDAEPPSRPLVRARPVPVPAGPLPAAPLPAGPERAASERSVLAGPVTAVHPDAHRFVLSTLRPVFEVLDRRRPAKHLTTIASATVVDVLRTLAESGAGSTVTGWGNVHVAAPRTVPARPRRRTDDPDVGAEIFLTYSRGERVLAAAGRVEAAAGRWRWVAFTTAA
ncbi:hypothetical protein GCM10027289_09590 [Tsukamurella serpentis]